MRMPKCKNCNQEHPLGQCKGAAGVSYRVPLHPALIGETAAKGPAYRVAEQKAPKDPPPTPTKPAKPKLAPEAKQKARGRPKATPAPDDAKKAAAKARVQAWRAKQKAPPSR